MILRSHKRLIYTAITFLYCILLLAAHEHINNLSVTISNRLTLPVYNQYINTAEIILIVAFLFFVILKFRRRFLPLTALWGGLFIVIQVFNNTILVVSAEKIHYFQYVVLILLLSLLIVDLRKAIVYAALFGVIDELYQFLFIHANIADVYIDFNDMLLNLAGAFAGVLLLRTFSAGRDDFARRLNGSPLRRFYTLSLSAAAVLVIFALIIENGGWQGEFLNMLNDAFWQPDGEFFRNVEFGQRFHRTTFLEAGCVSTALFSLFVFFLRRHSYEVWHYMDC